MKNYHADAARQAAFDAHFDEYFERYGGDFYFAWHFGRDPALIQQFYSALARKTGASSLDELGAALCPDEPLQWKEEEQLAWVLVLGSDALPALADKNRDRLVGLAIVTGRVEHARRWGLRL